MTRAVEKLANMPCTCFTQEFGPQEDCPTCNGSGALVPGLRQSHTCNYADPRCSKDCQGRDWVLIPGAEVMGVLVRVKDGATLYKMRNKWLAKLPFEGTNGVWGKGDTPEEALAEAICQAKGVA